MQAEALTDLNPGGQVRVGLEEWSAVALEGEISKGSQVRIKGVAGVRLQVLPLNDDNHEK